MENVEQYRAYIEQVIRKYAQYKPAHGEVEVQMIFDREHDHYQLGSVGWHGQKRIRGCVLQLDIKQGKIWIQHDGTADSIANELVEMGVPKHDIVLAYRAPYNRQFTEFAVG
jgi:hypothetical protein